MNGGDRVAAALSSHGVSDLFTLCGGHISPILVGCKLRGITVTDVRHEATAVFAADAVSRLTGTTGVAAVTAGPGVSNTVTAVKNAQLAQSPVLVLGGATATLLRGRGALQDIDQMALIGPHVKSAVRVARVRDLAPAVDRALKKARDGVPGPVFVECPVDLLYDEATVREWYAKAIAGRSLAGRLQAAWVRRHLGKLFAGSDGEDVLPGRVSSDRSPSENSVRRAASLLASAIRPVVLVGSQAVSEVAIVGRLAEALENLGAPVYLSGMARGLLGENHPLHRRHRRRDALRQADVVVLAGVPCDFRLDYGKQIGRGADVIAINRSSADLRRNRKHRVAVVGDPAAFVIALASHASVDESSRAEWLETLRERDGARQAEIDGGASSSTAGVDPLHLCREIDRSLGRSSIIVADGGDFVGTASYVVRPRGPLTWLDPGPFGTLGVGAGFAIGAKRSRPEGQVWILYGDGSVGFSLAEFDTFARHGLPVIAVVGNDGCWSQIAREQVPLLGDDVGCALARTDYHAAAEGLGGKGILVRAGDEVRPALERAREAAAHGTPVLVNVHLAASDFRKGSISI
jgi:acetolactate synthase-1/2/3 large subunit